MPVTTPSRPRPPTATRSPTAGVAPAGAGAAAGASCAGSEQPLDDLVHRGARLAAHRAGVARRERGAPASRPARSARRLGLQVGDDVVDLAPRLAHLRLELFGQPAAERFLALAQRLFALAHAARRSARAPRARARPAGARARARACRGRSSRGARRAALRACSGSARALGDNGGFEPEPRRRSRARGCVRASRRSADRSARTSSGSNPNAAHVTPRVVDA